MGSYVFRWPYPANDVHVTGTFDDWGKTVQLYKVGDVWEREVDLPSADEKVYYKFVVDNLWIVDDSVLKTDDGHWNINNILLPEQIKRKEVVPTQTTPGAFPETPAGEPDSFIVQPIPATGGASNPISLPAGQKVPDSKEITSSTIGSTATTSKEDYENAGNTDFPSYKTGETAEYSVSPIPASSGIGNPVNVSAGEKLPEHKDVTSNTIDSTVTTSKEDYEKAGTAPFPASTAADKSAIYSINPIPASSGIGNPISLPAGAKAPASEDVTSNTIDSTATTSKEDYDNSGKRSTGAIAGIAAGATAGAAALGGAIASALKKPEEKKNLIPESSLPMGGEALDTLDAGPFVSSVGPGTSASELAAHVPLEKKREAAVIDADRSLSSTAPFLSSAAPETSTSELASHVPLESNKSATVVDPGHASKLSAPFLSSAAPGSTTSGLAAGLPLAEKRQGMVIDPSDIPASASPFTSSAGPAASASILAAGIPLAEKREATLVDPSTITASAVPAAVQHSLAQAHKDPEASASAEAVREKTDVEKELLSKTQRSEATGASAAAAVAQSSYYGLATTVPKAVESSMQKAHALPEAAADTSAVAEKSAMERELLAKVQTTDEAGKPAPTLAAATSATAPATTTTAHTPTGSAPFAAAAVSDGTTDTPHVGSKISHPVEKSEALTTEYAPVRTDGSAPGVSSAAAAALSDGTEDPTLIDEPAVKTTQHNKAGTTVHDITTSATTAAENSAHASADKDIVAASATTVHDATTSPIAAADYTTSATVRDVAGLPSTVIQDTENTVLQTDATADAVAKTSPLAASAEKSATLPESKTSGITNGSASAVPAISGIPALASTGTTNTSTTGEKKATGAATTGTGSVPAPSTPVKKTTNTSALSSPASSAATGDTNKKKKHRHRISAFFHKHFD